MKLSSFVLAALLCSPAAAKSSPATPAMIEKIIQFAASTGKEDKVVAQFANPLGLTASGSDWPALQATMIQSARLRDYEIFVSPRPDQDIVLDELRRADNGRPIASYTFRANRDGIVISAFIYDMWTDRVTMRDPVEAQDDFSSECGLWANHIDELNASPRPK
jgi:hypothetical protein